MLSEDFIYITKDKESFDSAGHVSRKSSFYCISPNFSARPSVRPVCHRPCENNAEFGYRDCVFLVIVCHYRLYSI